MRAYLSVKFDRPVDEDKHFISPGGYEVKTSSGMTIGFDFGETIGNIRKDDPTIVDFELRYEDKESFSDMEKLLHSLPEVTQLTECYIFTGEHDDPELNVEKILAFAIEGSDPRITQKPADTEYVTCEVMGQVSEEPPIILYTFTEKLLDTLQMESPQKRKHLDDYDMER